jgi:hypothetical protein
MTKIEQIQQAARLWIDRSQRDVAEIRLDDLLNPTGEDAIEEIHFYGDQRLVVIVQGSRVTRIAI